MHSGDCFTKFYTDPFCSSNPSIPFDLANLISPVITSEDYPILDSIPIVEEIFRTIKSLGSTKASGPDGLPALFYKQYWDIVDTHEKLPKRSTKEDIREAIRQGRERHRPLACKFSRTTEESLAKTKIDRAAS